MSCLVSQCRMEGGHLVGEGGCVKAYDEVWVNEQRPENYGVLCDLKYFTSEPGHSHLASGHDKIRPSYLAGCFIQREFFNKIQ